MKKFKLNLLILVPVFFISPAVHAQKGSIAYTVSMEDPEWHYFHVELICSGVRKDYIDFKMPVWTPGYYQRLNFADNVKGFNAYDAGGSEIKWEKISENTWRVYSGRKSPVRLKYEIKAERSFVATPYLDENRGYILPAGTFFYPDGMLDHPVQVRVVPYEKWHNVATGLDSVAGSHFVYRAPDFDILYDSPLLVGNLEELPPFKVNGVTHRFIGIKLGEFDREKFMNDLKKIVEASVNLIGDLPYKHYTFLAIGPGPGGIEHLNSTTFGFNGNNLSNKGAYVRIMHFLAHEYFHHYNVKRIRPVELGPFDYDKGSRTKMLWFSEGLSVYYEYLVVKRAGISSEEEILDALRNNITSYEKRPGRFFQTLEQASYETWSDGPFGRVNDEVDKTISYYEKGPIVGFMLDMKIRDGTGNTKSLDDVMRYLYREYYQKRKRGFTDDELRKAFQTVSRINLNDEFEYIITTKPLVYPPYFRAAGLTIDTGTRILPGGYAGFAVRERQDTLYITSVDWQSPAWQSGLRRGMALLKINDNKANADLINTVLSISHVNDTIRLTCMSAGILKQVEIIFTTKTERTFRIGHDQDAGTKQKQILESWLKG